MSNEVLNTLILSFFLAAAVGGGYYVTRTLQPEELASVEEEIETIENRTAEVEELMAQEATASTAAAAALTRWNSRYKVLPADLASADVVAYLNALSSEGFRRFDITLEGMTPSGSARYYTYQVSGEAYYESLFAFIWHVENNRGLYRVRDLSIQKSIASIPNEETGVDRRVVLASFNMSVDAFFGAPPEMSAPNTDKELPDGAFPARRTANNPFFPYVFESLPPNTDDLIDVDTDSLVSVVGATAVFLRNNEMREVQPGSPVYLGRVTSVNPREATVRIALNKGGIREDVTLNLNTGERYRQAFGRQTLSPQGRPVPEVGPVLDVAPPPPGTPGAERSGLYQSGDYEEAELNAQPPRVPQPAR